MAFKSTLKDKVKSIEWKSSSNNIPNGLSKVIIVSSFQKSIQDSGNVIWDLAIPHNF